MEAKTMPILQKDKLKFKLTPLLTKTTRSITIRWEDMGSKS